MAFDTNITPGAPPLLWSNVNQAFKQINENFDILVATIGDGSGLTPINFETLDTSVSPTSTNTYTIGTITKQWKRLHTAEWQDAGDDSLNGIWLGNAQIKGKGYVIDLPVGSTVDGSLIIDPDKTFIKTIQVDGDKSLESDVYGYTANFTSGLGIALQITSASDEIEFNVDPTFDLTGSIYADDTTLLVDRLGYIRGNVNVTGDWTVTANSNVWEFDSSGILTLPSGATLKEVGSNDILQGAASNTLIVSSDQDLKIVTAANSGIVTWTFKDTGEFVVPSSVDFEYSGSPTFNLSTTTTAGRLVGEANKTFSIVLTDGTDTFEWAYATDGSVSFPGGQTIDSTGYSGDVNGLNVTADTFIVGTFSTTPASSYFEVEGASTNRVRMGGPNQLDVEFRSYFATPAAGDEGSRLLWRQNTDITDDLTLVEMFSRVTDTGNTTESGELEIRAIGGGSYYTSAIFTADGITANVYGTLSGNVTGNVTGDLTGNVTGDLTGNVTGDVTGGAVSATTLRTSESEIALGVGAGNTTQGSGGIAIGAYAGGTTQGNGGVAIGYAAGSDTQGNTGIAIGYSAGNDTQGAAAVAIGFGSGTTTQGGAAVAIGYSAGADTQGSNSVAIGYVAGNNTQGTGAVAIGYTAAQVTQGDSAVAIGWGAGQTNQGANSIAIGFRAGFTNQNASSIVLNASGVALEAAAAGFFVNPVRSAANGTPLMYDTATSELVYSNVLEFVGSRISTTDSSGIIVDVLTTFNTQVNVEGTLTVGDGITGYISLAELKSIVAASADFADFQIRMAAL